MPREVARRVLAIEAEAIARLVERLDARFDEAVDLILKSAGRVVVSGMGKSGMVGRKIASTLASTGTPSFFLHPADAMHGDIGMLVPGDVVLALSNSGETAEVCRLLELVKRLDFALVAVVGNGDSTLGRAADVTIDLGITREACPLDLAPSASTTATLAMGDALAFALSRARGFTAADFARHHPGGHLGKRLTAVKDLMRTGDAVPRVAATASMLDAVAEMSRKGLGMTTVIEDGGRLVGVLTDGDLRRLIARGTALYARPVGECASADPKRIGRDEVASRALALMEEWKITALVVVGPDDRVEGVLHLHDLWRLELF
jgi:arabinose-5-phosphate isomerase